MSLNKFTGQSNTGSQSWMEINAKSIKINNQIVGVEKLYNYEIGQNESNQTYWKVFSLPNGQHCVRFSGSRDYEIPASTTNQSIQVLIPPEFQASYTIDNNIKPAIVNCVLGVYVHASAFGISSSTGFSHDNLRMLFDVTTDSVANARPSVLSYDIILSVTPV